MTAYPSTMDSGLILYGLSRIESAAYLTQKPGRFAGFLHFKTPVKNDSPLSTGQASDVSRYNGFIPLTHKKNLSFLSGV